MNRTWYWLVFDAALIMVGVGFSSRVSGGPIQAQSVDAGRVYPNPWRADQHELRNITFANLPPQSRVRVFTVAGYEVQTLTTDSNGSVEWNRRNRSGDLVASGVYLYTVSSQGRDTIGKLAIIR